MGTSRNRSRVAGEEMVIMAHPYRAWSSLVWRGLVVAVMVAAAGNADATILFSDAFS